MKVGGEEREYCRRPRGIAIGNVTSQIFANIYLNEFDRHVKHTLGVRRYLRYGDDFVMFAADRDTVSAHRENAQRFLHDRLSLVLHGRNDVIFPCKDGLKFLGCILYPMHRYLQKRVWTRVLQRTDRGNISSYRGLVRGHCNREMVKYFDWSTLKFLDE